MLNRRSFLRRFGIGVSAALALTQVPAVALEGLSTEQAAFHLVRVHLRRWYSEYCAAHRAFPRVVRVSRGLFAAYEADLLANERFYHDSHEQLGGLMFKGARLLPEASLRGWEVCVAEVGAL